MEDLLVWLQTQLTQNDIFAGIVGGSFLGSGLYLMRRVPERLWQVFLHHCTCYLTVYSEDEAFAWVNEWLARQPYSRRARRLKLSTFYRRRDEDDQPTWSLAPGQGNHLFLYRGRVVWLEREIQEGAKDASVARFETFKIRVFSRSQEIVHKFVEDARSLRNDADQLEVFGYHGYWQRHDRRPHRPLESVVLPEDQVRRIVDDAERFLASRQWYVDRGIPYRRGYLLSGPPGCGKTSLATALASHLGRPVYVLNIGAIYGDDRLFEAMGGVPAGAVLLIEDIDAAQTSRIRKSDDSKDDDEMKPVTLSGLLNAIDGVLSRDGRLLVMTTNFAERLDPALVRPGRVDLHERIGPLGPSDLSRLYLRFFPEERDTAEYVDLNAETPLPGAEAQGRLLLHRSDPLAAAEALVDPSPDGE